MNTEKYFGTVYEFCKGKDLFSSLSLAGPRKEEECIKYFAQLVLAVKQIHERGLYHGNLDSRHVLFKNEMGSRDQVVKVSGFTKTGQVENADYLPPECILNSENYSQAADIWSLGVILLQMATGIERPFNTSRFKKFQESVEQGHHRKLYMKEHRFSDRFVKLLDGCF
jgi:serine/threonine-protein kinase